MTSSSDIHWSDLLQRTLACYDEPLLRQVAGRLVRPRNQWPIEDLIERSGATATNPAVVDRRLQELGPASRQALALIGCSRQPQWGLGNLIEMLMALGQPDGLKPLFALFEHGLLFPKIANLATTSPTNGSKLRSFEQWLALANGGLQVFTHPQIAARAVGEPLGLPDLSAPDSSPARNEESEQGEKDGLALKLPDLRPRGTPHEADGLEWLLRLAVLWQQVTASPIRRTQQGGFFKRDQERLQSDPLLTAPPHENLVEAPDRGFLLAALAEQIGVLVEADGELRAGPLPAVWEAGLWPALESFWSELWRVALWDPLDGWRAEPVAGNPFASAYLLTFLLLARLPEPGWMSPAVIQDWLLHHHPYWKGDALRPSWQEPWLERFLLGVAYHFRLVQAAKSVEGGWLVRLTPAARWLLLLAEAPEAPPVFAQSLLIQPNLEVLAYRQGLTPALIQKLTRFASWKSLGAACTLQLEPESVYRGLEAGQTFDSIRLTLEQHGTRATPPAVLDALRTWSNKRDRITVYPSATLLEFSSAEDLNDALARGLPGVRIADTLAVVASEDDIDFKHFRLSGTRDYSLPPEKCVTLEPDGVTLTVDLTRSDLLLETELPRSADLISHSPGQNQRQYRLTPASLARAHSSGITVTTLETWFQQRCGQPLSPAARMLFSAGQLPAPQFQRLLVLQLASAELADGLVQWPATRSLIASRLGPTSLVVAEEQVPALREKLREAGLPVPDF
jgi:hypothetical protein